MQWKFKKSKNESIWIEKKWKRNQGVFLLSFDVTGFRTLIHWPIMVTLVCVVFAKSYWVSFDVSGCSGYNWYLYLWTSILQNSDYNKYWWWSFVFSLLCCFVIFLSLLWWDWMFWLWPLINAFFFVVPFLAVFFSALWCDWMFWLWLAPLCTSKLWLFVCVFPFLFFWVSFNMTGCSGYGWYLCTLYLCFFVCLCFSLFAFWVSFDVTGCSGYDRHWRGDTWRQMS